MAGECHYLPRERLGELIDAVRTTGYRLHGPTIREGAIAFEEISSVDQLPIGISDEQSPGRYRLRQRDDRRCFAWANGPQALKPHTFAPRESLWRVERDSEGRLEFKRNEPDAPLTAVIGARACDLAAMAIQDQHFLHHPPSDPQYAARREQLLVIAVNCSHPADTCFCAATGDGPEVKGGYDLLLDELDDGFLLSAEGDVGEAILVGLALNLAEEEKVNQARQQVTEAAEVQTRTLPKVDLQRVLFDNLEHPRWSNVGERCLSCANCTAVCPTCFCHREVEEPALGLDSSEHLREWDSCFTAGHSALHGTPIRGDTRMRYRQWLTHKMGSWHEQFDRSGCVGCGRCISWCPAAIDITEEVAAIAGEESA